MNVTRIALRRPLTVVMIFAAIALLGLVAVFQLPIEQMPSVSFPIVVVHTLDPGANSTTVEDTVTNPLQQALTSISGVSQMQSVSSSSSSVIRLYFAEASDVTVDANEVAQVIARAQGSLPVGVQTPSVLQVNPFATPIMTVNLSSAKLTPAQMYTFAQSTVVPQLQQLTGVGQINLVGGEEPAVNVVVDPNLLASYGFSLNTVTNALGQQNITQNGGAVSGGAVNSSVLTNNQAQTPQELAQTVIGLANGNAVTLAQVAKVTEGFAPLATTHELNGRPAVGLEITAQSGANEVAVDSAVKQALKSITANLPPGVQLKITSDATVFTIASLQATAMDVLLAIGLASLVILLFLQSLRQTLAVLIAIPTALFATFLVMWILGFSIDLISLLAISLLVGILVDDAIVVLENITRHYHLGEDAMTAAFNGRMEIGGAALALTLTDIVVYLPIAFLSGNIGQIFREFGITVAVATLFSLFISFTLTPMLASRLLGDKAEKRPIAFALAWRTAAVRALSRMGVRYENGLRRALRHRNLVWMSAFAALFLTLFLVRSGIVGSDLAPQEDTGEVNVTVQMSPGATLPVTSAAIRRLAYEVKGIQGVTDVQTDAGNAYGGGTDTSQGNLTVDLVPKTQRTDSLNLVQSEIRRMAKGIPGMQVTTSVPSPMSPGGFAPVSVIIRGSDVNTLNLLANAVTGRLQTIPILTQVQNQVSVAAPAWNVQVDEATAARYGLTAQSVGRALQTAIAGTTEGYVLPPTGLGLPITVTVAGGNSMTPTELAQLPVGVDSNGTPGNGGVMAAVTLGQVASISAGSSPQKLQEYDLLPQVAVQAYPRAGVPLGKASGAVKKILNAFPFPPGYSYTLGGQTQQQKNTNGPLLQAFGLSVVLMYMLLVGLYQSWVLPLTILFALPLATVGAIAALAMTGNTLNLFSLIGLIMLIGLVGKNGILLVDYAETLRSGGLRAEEAIIQSARARIRPIMMTTLTMVIAMLPLAFAAAPGSEYRAPMALVIAGGMTSSTILTLFIVPVIYLFIDGMRRKSPRANHSPSMSNGSVTINELP